MTEKQEMQGIDWKQYINPYQNTVILPGSGESIIIKPVTTKQMKRLLIYEDSNDPSALEIGMDEMISTSVISEDFKPMNLYIQDRFYLLLEIRKASKGSEYSFTNNCEHCGGQSKQNIDLNTLNVKKLPEKIDNVVEINENLCIEFDLLKREHQHNAMVKVLADKTIENENLKVVEIGTFVYAYSIKKITVPQGDIIPSIEEAYYLLDNLNIEGTDKISKFFESIDFGIEMSYEKECPHCKEKEKIEIPLDKMFY